VCANNLRDSGHSSAVSFRTVRLWERLTFDTSGEIIILPSADQVAPRKVGALAFSRIRSSPYEVDFRAFGTLERGPTKTFLSTIHDTRSSQDSQKI
jgi:hypothetical protein